MPNCPRCKHAHFTVSEITPTGSNFKFNAIHCSACGCVVGVVDYFNIGQVLHNLAKALNVKI